jgi:hypothetical protein
MKKFSLLLCVLLGSVLLGWTQQPGSGSATAPTACCDAIEQHMKAMEDRIILLEGQVRLLKQQLAQAQSAPTGETTATAAAAGVSGGQTVATGEGGTQLPNYGGAGAAAKALNPDISAIGDFISDAGHYPTPPGSVSRQAGAQSLNMHESELGFQAIIDPYARGDFFISFGEEGVELEEGYVTFTALPLGFVARVGKMRAAFGKVNTMHNHVLPWADRPLVNENLVGGEDGIDDAGFSIQRILPAPKGIFLEATGQLFRGDSGAQTYFVPVSPANPTGTIIQTLFSAGDKKSDVSTVEHLRAYRDITESTNLDLGLSYARGHNELGSNFLTQLYGMDATLRWKPLRRSIYHSFIGRTEAIWSQRQQPLVLPSPLNTISAPGEQRSFGMYASGDYQLGRRWFMGGRYDYAQRARDDRQLDRGAAAVLTYWPSEFSQIRGEYRFTRYAEGISANELLMQVQFSLGAHGAHPF